MRAFIIAVGSELLGTDRLDTNSLKIAERLETHGVDLVGKSVVGDVHADLQRHLVGALATADLVVLSGGLGPTTDDLTREAVAAVLNRTMSEDPAIIEDMRRKFRGFGMAMPDSNRCQALVIEGAVVLDNRKGTAPGQRIEHDGRTIFLLPGVPVELEHLLERHVDSWLAANSTGQGVHSRSLRVACRSESAVEESLRPLYQEFDPHEITVLSSPGDIELRFTVHGDSAESESRLESMTTAARRALGGAVYGEGRDPNLAAVVGGLLRDRDLTVATAESCTGGLLAERLTRVAGSSEYFVGSIVSYSNQVKRDHLAVPEELLQRHGAVSPEVAIAMARGARSALCVDFAISVTGVAGPGGGSATKPIGTVHVGIVGPSPEALETVDHRQLKLSGDRGRIRLLSSQWALELLRRRLLGDASPR